MSKSPSSPNSIILDIYAWENKYFSFIMTLFLRDTEVGAEIFVAIGR